MPSETNKPLVIGISSRALLNLEKEDAVFRELGTQGFIDYQREHQEELIPKGVAFPLVKSLLELNKHFEERTSPAVNVVIISRNHPDCGVRILRSLGVHGKEIPQAAFTGGEPVVRELRMFNVDLFLSYQESDVVEAVRAGVSSARIFGGPTELGQFTKDAPLLAFDGDSTLFSDEGDRAFKSGGIEAFKQVEFSNLGIPLEKGPMYRFVNALAALQSKASILNPPFRIALVTARNFQYMQRPIETLRGWGIRLDKAYLIGTMKKSDVLRDLRAVMFFDDSQKNCADAAEYVPTAIVVSADDEVGTVTAVNELVSRLEKFDSICKLVLRKDFSTYQQSLSDQYETQIVELSDEDFAAKMAEFKRSVTGTPKGNMVKERRAAGQENTQYQKLVSYLNDLLPRAAQSLREG